MQIQRRFSFDSVAINQQTPPVKNLQQLSAKWILFFSTNASLAATPLPCEVSITNSTKNTRAPRILVHQLAVPFLASQMSKNFSVSSEGQLRYRFSNNNVIWARDRFPLRIIKADGKIKLLAYASLLNLPNQLFFDGGSTYIPVHPPKDSGPNALPYSLPSGGYEWLEVEALPLFLEGGNIQINDGVIFVGEKVFQQNSKSLEEWMALIQKHLGGSSSKLRRDLIEKGYRPRSETEVRLEFSAKTGVSPDKIIKMPWLPGEKTGHVDVYLGRLNEKTLVIPQIQDSEINALSMNHEREFAQKTKDWLDKQSAEVSRTVLKLGIRVIRIPMLPPRNLVPSSISPLGWDAQFPSTVNFIVDGSRILVPDFPNFADSLQKNLSHQLREQIKITLEAEGFEVVFINSEELLSHNGLLHCISGEI